jgi:beta-N-acetylhexosaminidase
MRRVGPAAAAGLAAIFLVGVSGTSSSAGWGVQIPPSADGLGARKLAGMRVIAGFDGHTPPRGLRRMIASGQIAGVILFSDNVGGRRQVRRLTRSLRAIDRPAGVNQRLLVMVDQEGGQVRRLSGPPRASAEEVGTRGADAARSLGRATGDSLSDMGVNVNLAPVLDVPRPGGFIDDQDRGYSRRPGRVGAIGSAFAAGMESRGVAATAKHFPGLGAGAVTTDEQSLTLRLSRRTLRRVDEAPYEQFISAGGSLVMLGLARYPALGGGPAALSKRIATRELRGRLGFDGVSNSDALGAPAATPVGGTAKVALRSAKAGTDLLLYSDAGSAHRAFQTLRRAIRRGALPRSRAVASAARVLELTGSLGE